MKRKAGPSLWLVLRVVFKVLGALGAILFSTLWISLARTPQAPVTAPVVNKIEPPNWWVGITPEVMLLLSGQNLEATHVTCNLPTVTVSRTQSSAGGRYLFVWLKIASDTRTGVAICRITTTTGQTSLELPLAARTPTLGKFQGLGPEDVIYQIAPDRSANGDMKQSHGNTYHGGELRGIRDHLPYLKNLGVTTLLLTPILASDTRQQDHGFGAVDLYAIDTRLGTLDDYKELVAAAHEQHMKVLFDAVINNVGPRHPWVADPPMADWFHGRPKQHADSSDPLKNTPYGRTESKPSTTSLDPLEVIVDPHAPARWKRLVTDTWYSGVLPDLNTENPIVAQYLLQNSIWWAETSGLDGFDLDAFPYVPRKFWSDWHAGIHRIYPNMTTIGEVIHADPSVTSFFAGGQRHWDLVNSGVTTVFDFPLCFVLRDVLLQGAAASNIADVLRHDSLYPHPERLVEFLGNANVPQFTNADATQRKLGLALVLTLRGIPELYYGDEMGIISRGDPVHWSDFPFVPEKRTPEQKDIFAYVQALLRLRREHPVLQNGQLWHLASDDASYIFLRESEDERVLVAFNHSNQAHGLRVPLNETPAQGAAGASSLLGDAKVEFSNGEAHLDLPARSITVFLLN